MKNLVTVLGLMASAFTAEAATTSVASTLENAPTQHVQAGGTRFAYRKIGHGKGVPLVLLQHFTGTMDYWDPAVVDGLAKDREVIVFDNTGVGGSSGTVPDNVEQMSADALAFVQAIGLKKVDLLGYSLGGMIAQELAAQHPELVRKVVLANTAHQGGGNHLMEVLGEAMSQKKYPDPRMVLFFTDSKASIAAGEAFLKRASARKADRDPEPSPDVGKAQGSAIIAFSTTNDPANKLLTAIAQPVLVVSGSDDKMLPTDSSIAMFKILKNAKLVLYPDSNHGAIFQYHDDFVAEVDRFLEQ
ncbi:pimeloyl-ACP methyl ester carboxylesterase [Luteibacter sp. HA06]